MLYPCRYETNEALKQFEIFFPVPLDESLKSLFHPPDMELKYETKATSNVSDVLKHAECLESYYASISMCLDTLAFAVGNNVKLFIKYIKYFLKQMPSTDNEIEGSNENRLSCLNTAIVNAAYLIERIIHGTATVDDIQVTCDKDLAEIELNHESECLMLYSEWQGFSQIDINMVYTATIELFQVKDHLIRLQKVLNQFELRKIVKSSELAKITMTVNQMSPKLPEMRRKLTVLSAIEKYRFICDNLCMEGKISSHQCFHLFEAYEKSMLFFQYAKERGFIGCNGTRKFKEQHQLVTEELLHENFHDTIMDHLLGAFKFFEPLFVQADSLKKLMSVVTQFDHIERAVKQIETVNENISLVRLWFDSTEVSLICYALILYYIIIG